jgi:hypothetical protein
MGVDRDKAAPERHLDHRSVALEPARRPDGDDTPRLRGRDRERAEDADVDAGMGTAAVVTERSRDGSLGRPGRPLRRRRLLHADVRKGKCEQKREYGRGA